MKLKNKIYSLVFIFSALILLVFLFSAVNIFSNSYTALYIVSFVLLCVFVLMYFLVFKLQYYVKSIMQIAEKSLNTDEKKFLKSFPLPVLIVSKNDDIIWGNESFFTNVAPKNECIGDKISKYLKAVDLMTCRSTMAIIDDRRYTVLVSNFEEGAILSFVDDTDYKKIKETWEKSRPCVVTVNFDNREEINEDVDKVVMYTSTLSKIESVLMQWAVENQSFLKKLTNGRYLLIMEAEKLHQQIENKFDVLDKIRQIRFAENRFTTISIGVGCDGKTFEECEKWSQKALEMALGRGGDQAVVKEKDKFTFFGGVSQGIETKDRVRIRIVAMILADAIKKSERVLIMGHKYSDLDSIGSALGMCAIAKKLGVEESHIVVNKDKSLAQVLIDHAEKNGADGTFISEEEALNMPNEKTLLIVVDTHSMDRIESEEVYKSCYNVVVIDHHRMLVNHIKNSSVFFHDPVASSSSEMVTDLSRYMGENTLGILEAQALLAGIMLDTKNFVLRTGVRTFEAAALLKNIGADMVDVKGLFANTIDAYKNKYKIINNVKIFDGYAVSHIDDDIANQNISAAQAADELLEIQGVKVSFVVFKSGDDISISARSLRDVNVQVLMERFGGGGHQTMAGAQIKNSTVKEVEKRLIEMIKQEIDRE